MIGLASRLWLSFAATLILQFETNAFCNFRRIHLATLDKYVHFAIWNLQARAGLSPLATVCSNSHCLSNCTGHPHCPTPWCHGCPCLLLPLCWDMVGFLIEKSLKRKNHNLLFSGLQFSSRWLWKWSPQRFEPQPLLYSYSSWTRWVLWQSPSIHCVTLFCLNHAFLAAGWWKPSSDHWPTEVSPWKWLQVCFVPTDACQLHVHCSTQIQHILNFM